MRNLKAYDIVQNILLKVFLLVFIIISLNNITVSAQNDKNSQKAPCIFTADIQGVDVDCYGNNTGSVDLTVIGTTGPYTFLWSNGETTEDISSLFAGTYFVQITDNTGCKIIEFITIEEPSKLEIDHIEIVDVLCNGGNSGSIELFITGGYGNYQYVWNDGNSSRLRENLIANDYIVNIYDENYCTLTDTISVIEPDELTVSQVVSNVTGYGLSDGFIDVTVSGGVMPYQYQWELNSNLYSTLEDIYNIVAGDYDLSVTDFNNCNLNKTIPVTQPPPLAVSFIVKDVDCKNGSDGEIDATVTGGVSPYSYLWSDEQVVLTQTTNLITGLTKGKYTVTITDANQIELIDSVELIEPSPILVNLDVTDATCYDGSDGYVELSASGGTPVYTYVWSNGANTQNLENVEAGEYSVLVVDNNGCSFQGEIVVGQPDQIVISADVKSLTCRDSHDGEITIEVSGGIPPYDYSWSNGETNKDINELFGGIYEISVQDDHDCIMEKEYEILIPDLGCIWIPSAFTPNDDGINDFWDINNSFLYPDIEVQVFNIWGKIVFESSGYKSPWDGMFNGQMVPSGTYYYIVNTNNGDKIYTGVVTIVK